MSDPHLPHALRILARDIHCEDGIATQCIREAADEIDRLRAAIRRLAEQDATLSVCEGNVTVDMDATLTDAEREAVEWASDAYQKLLLPASRAGQQRPRRLRPRCRHPSRPAGADEMITEHADEQRRGEGMDNTNETTEPSGASGGSLAWIPVSERLPDQYEIVMVGWAGRRDIGKGYLLNGKWHDPLVCRPDVNQPAHWMPLPEPPPG